MNVHVIFEVVFVHQHMKKACNVGDEGARELSEALKFNRSLTSLNLSCNE